MVEPVDDLVKFAKAGADLISFTLKQAIMSTELLERLKMSCQSGLVLNPASPLSLIEDLLES